MKKSFLLLGIILVITSCKTIQNKQIPESEKLLRIVMKQMSGEGLSFEADTILVLKRVSLCGSDNTLYFDIEHSPKMKKKLSSKNKTKQLMFYDEHLELISNQGETDTINDIFYYDNLNKKSKTQYLVYGVSYRKNSVRINETAEYKGKKQSKYSHYSFKKNKWKRDSITFAKY